MRAGKFVIILAALGFASAAHANNSEVSARLTLKDAKGMARAIVNFEFETLARPFDGTVFSSAGGSTSVFCTRRLPETSDFFTGHQKEVPPSCTFAVAASVADGVRFQNKAKMSPKESIRLARNLQAFVAKFKLGAYRNADEDKLLYTSPDGKLRAVLIDDVMGEVLLSVTEGDLQ